MNHSYDQYEGVKEIKVNDFCGVLNGVDNLRSQILSFSSDGAIYVFLIDYGNTIVASRSEIFVLNFEHAGIEPLSIAMQINVLNDDVKDMSESAKEKLLEKFKRLAENTDQFLIFVNGLASGDVYKYDVILFADDQTKNTYILNEYYAAFNYTQVKFEKDYCKKWFQQVIQGQSDFEIDSRFGRKFLVEIVHIESPVALYVRNQKHHNRLKEIRQKINSFVRSVKPQVTPNWSFGKYCLCITQNPLVESKMLLWYRGRILKKNTIAHTYDVFICDYGYTVQVNESSLMPIPDDLRTFKDSVQFCALDISHILSVEQDIAMSLLRELIKSYKYLAVSFSEYTAVVTLWGSSLSYEVGWDHYWDDLNVKLMSQLMRDSMNTFIKKTQYSYNSTKFGGEFPNFEALEDLANYDSTSTQQNVAEEIFSSESSLKAIDRWKLPEPLAQTDVYGVVTHIHETGIIFAQIGKDHERVKDLEKSISEYVKTVTKRDTSEHVFKKNGTCFAKHGKYYRRSIITHIYHEEVTCQVMFVDYGEKMTARLNDLYPAKCFDECAILARRFYIPEVVSFSRNKKWSQYTVQQCRDWMINQYCRIKIKKSTKQNKILPCAVWPQQFKANLHLLTLIKNEKLFIEEKEDSNGKILYVV